MPNTSATGGFLPPAPLPAPLEGTELLDFIQEWIVGLSGLPGKMVRPSFQVDVPNIPNAGEVWAAFRIGERPADTYPYIGHLGGGDGSDRMQRNETLMLLISFYDLGSTGQADKYAALTRDMAVVSQNLEYLLRGDFVLVATGDLQPVPVLVKSRWLYRVDLPVALRRQINRDLAVQNVETAQGVLKTDSGIGPQPIVVVDTNP